MPKKALCRDVFERITDIFRTFAPEIDAPMRQQHLHSRNRNDMNNIPTITRNLLIINVIVFIAQLVVDAQSGYGMTYYGGLHFFLTDSFHIWQPFTYMFLHSDFMHIFFNMFALWMFGRTIELTFGAKRFLIYYLVCGIGAGVCQELVQLCSLLFFNTLSVGATIGASGAIYAILLAFGMSYPNERIFIFPIPFPIKAKWFVMIYVVIELYMAMGSSGDGVAHTAHLGGMLAGFLLITYWRRKAASGFYRRPSDSFFDKMRQATERFQRDLKVKKPKYTPYEEVRREDDMEYNARQKAKQDEIDAILDKIRKSGYDSLTKEEKTRLFDLSHND